MDENYDVKYEKYDKAVQLSEERSEGETLGLVVFHI